MKIGKMKILLKISINVPTKRFRVKIYSWMISLLLGDDATWILTSAFIIFTMQSGFGLVEAGMNYTFFYRQLYFSSEPEVANEILENEPKSCLTVA